MGKKSSRATFIELRKQMLDAGLRTRSEDAIICPLCWQETEIDNLTIEHIVPGSIGGTQTTLTCELCNNTDGSNLDSELVHYQKLADSIGSHGKVPAIAMQNGRRLAGNVESIASNLKFTVVAKASNPRHIAASLDDAKQGKIESLDLTFAWFDQVNLKIAALRAGYLVAFRCLGYEYVQHEIFQEYRKQIRNSKELTIPVDSLVIELPTFSPSEDRDFYVGECVFNDFDLYVMIIRSRILKTTYWGVFFPTKDGSFFDQMQSIQNSHKDGPTLKITPSILK